MSIQKHGVKCRFPDTVENEAFEFQYQLFLNDRIPE
ncbi:hypothetical protein M7I_5953 [Glarea lozoyensis 74030]|uniref:Uncharacterized protein n=1 Tax=Glarea lozoyensis (strain ATCC 74030 / MF5533) TaxID=1104152 RepID=H0ET94_GLAL7|nr:hypothetical protein M7I_5953 [Glarea lozoyensis 74030]